VTCDQSAGPAEIEKVALETMQEEFGALDHQYLAAVEALRKKAANVRRPALSRRAVKFIQERTVDQLDVDPAVLNHLDRVGDLHQLTGGGVGTNEAAWLEELRGLSRQYSATIWMRTAR
jgi:hypothetical protein